MRRLLLHPQLRHVRAGKEFALEIVKLQSLDQPSGALGDAVDLQQALLFRDRKIERKSEEKHEDGSSEGMTDLGMQAMATGMASRGGLGIARMIERSLK